MIPTKSLVRHYVPVDFKITDWSSLKPYYEELTSREIRSVSDLMKWLKDRSEIDSIVSEDLAWRYIRMTCDTSVADYQEQFNFFINEIEPMTAPFANELNKKYFDSEFREQLKGKEFQLLTRNIGKEIQIFREENIPVFTEIQTEQKTYGATIGAMTVEVNGQEITLPRASDYLQNTDRNIREEVYRKIQKRRLQDKDKLDTLYSKLIGLRNQVAVNAGFANFRDYMFTALGRFDYSVKDCAAFHASVQEFVVPLIGDIAKERKASLKLEDLKPWDLSVDRQLKSPLKPFVDGNDLLEKTIQCFERLDPFLGNCLKEMRSMKHLDLESKKGKAPGGYNYPLYESGYPFIFMNATSNFRDMITLLHEGGHAVHSILTKDLDVVEFKSLPSEVAELASMSMELITMDYWDSFFDNDDDLKRAKRQHLESVMETLPWVAVIDKFQHWIYEHPSHSVSDRTAEWNKIYSAFSAKEVNWEGLEDFKSNAWQKQLHLFEVPFYYIEYGIAQLGAIGVWKNYKENPSKGLTQYLDALKLGNTTTTPEIYKTAGISFDFSPAYIKELMDFVKKEMEAL